MEIKIKGFITSKESEFYSDCADNYAFNLRHQKFAISDGVSKSFFSKIWSDILVNKYVNQKDWKNGEFITESQKEWQSKIDEIVNHPETKWFTKSQYNRKDPALATFVGLQFLESDQKWNAQALGDSFLFFIPKNSIEIEIKLSTNPEPIVFDNFPDYLSSVPIHSHKGENKLVEGAKIKEGTFYLMTDALAEWFLKDTSLAVEKLSNIDTQQHFQTTIEGERNVNRLKDDDSAVLIIEVIDDGKKDFSYFNSEVTLLSDFIKEEAEKLEEVKKKEISSQSFLNVNEEENKKEKQLTKDENSENEIIEKNEQPIEVNDIDNENSEEKPLDENESIKGNVTEDNLSVEKNNLSKQNQEEEKSSEPMQNIITDNPKTKSIFDKF